MTDAFDKLLAERRIEQALMGLGLSFADCAALTVYDPEEDTACWRFDATTGAESIHIGSRVASLDQDCIEMVLRHEILHRSMFHGFGEQFADHALANLTLDVCINRLLFETYPDKMRKLSLQIYSEEAKSSPIALADCSADPLKLPAALMQLWQSIWLPQAGELPRLNPSSLYFRLLKLRELPVLIGFRLDRGGYGERTPLGLPSLVRVVTADISKRLPRGSSLGRALSDFSVVPIEIGTSAVEEFLKTLQVRRVANQHAHKVLEPYARQIRQQIYPALPSRLGLLYQLCGISELVGLYWNRESALGGARVAIGIYVDVSGSMIGKLPIVATFVSALRELPLKIFLFDTDVRPAEIDDIAAGRIRGGGGTDFNAPVKHLLSEREIDAGVLFTDGEGALDDATVRQLRVGRKRLYVVYLVGRGERAGSLDRHATSTTVFHCEGT